MAESLLLSLNRQCSKLPFFKWSLIKSASDSNLNIPEKMGPKPTVCPIDSNRRKKKKRERVFNAKNSQL